MSSAAPDHSLLQRLARELGEFESRQLSPLACPSSAGVRRRPDPHDGYRQNFAQDADRILHSRAYSRYVDKTQVFSLVENDHITHRALHVQFVSRIARTIGRFLGLNEDLIEAVALGHDIGHPPFGHEGERILSRICRTHGLPSFQHNLQSVQFLDRFERGGQGWNLTLQVLDGILCHDGEAHVSGLAPQRDRTFARFDALVSAKERDPMLALLPMTLEGCVVRLADVIAYIGRDIEDAIELDLIRRSELPAPCTRVLGETNGTIVHTLVSDVIGASAAVRSGTEAGADRIVFTPEVADQLLALKRFNYERIYRNPAFKPDFERIHHCYEALFDHYLEQLQRDRESSEMGRSFLRSMDRQYLASIEPAAVVRDYLAGMTDDYFLSRAAAIGCPVPSRTCLPN